MRTSLAVIVTGLLLVLGGITGAELPVIAVLAVLISAYVVATCMSRFTQLGASMPPQLADRLPWLVTAGIVALAVTALIRLVLAATSGSQPS